MEAFIRWSDICRLDEFQNQNLSVKRLGDQRWYADNKSRLKKQGGGGDIVTVDKFKNFELKVDFRYTKGANSGIKYFIDTETNNGALASIGCEYQVLDDRNHPDAKAGINGNRTLAGLYDLIPRRVRQIMVKMHGTRQR